jgi:multicomponent Na+:H+ antiporter subunit C
MSVYFLCLILFCVGLYCVLRKRNLIKIIIGVVIIQNAISLLLVLTGYRMNGRSPIYSTGQVIFDMVDPLPQALVLTMIGSGLAIIVLIAAIAMRLYDKHGTFDITRIRNLKG